MIRLDPHQEVARDWLLEHPVGGLADEPRVGKTAPTLAAATSAGSSRMLVLCPAIAVGHWRQQVIEWGRGPAVQVLSYDLFARNTKVREQAIEWGPDTLVLDEFHYLRHATSLRARSVLGRRAAGDSPLLVGVTRVWCLSGTPMPSHAGELWPIFRALFKVPQTYAQWLERYCLTRETKFGIQVFGNRGDNLPELRSLFREHFIRRTFASVHGKDTEPLVWNLVPLALDRPNAMLEAYSSDPKMLALVERLQAGQETTDDVLELATLRRMTSTVKAPLVAEYARGYLLDNPGQKILVLGHHTTALRQVQDELQDFGAQIITGDTTLANREKRLERFAVNPTCRVMVGNIQACGVGIRLDAADVVMFLELDWIPGNNVQGAMRAQHRTKGTSVPVDVLTLAGSIDDVVARVRVRKLKMIEEVTSDGD